MEKVYRAERIWTAFLVTLIPLLLTGCAAAAAGAAASEAQGTVDSETIEYVRSHDLKPYIARAIERGQVVRGMSQEHVRFIMGEPKEVREQEDQEVWVYGAVPQQKRITFENGKVVDMIF